MIHAFILIVLIADKQEPSPMYFRSIDVCQYYAKAIPRQYGNYSYRDRVDPKDRITAYCKPVYVKDGPNIYDH